MWSHRAPCTSQRWPGDLLHGCTKALLPQTVLNTREINVVPPGLSVPNQADVAIPVWCCVQPRAEISGSCQVSPEGPVTLHPAELCSLHGAQGWVGWEAAR